MGSGMASNSQSYPIPPAEELDAGLLGEGDYEAEGWQQQLLPVADAQQAIAKR